MRVLVTRPEPGASRTAARLTALGHQLVVLPLSETASLETDISASILAADAVMATSAQAFRHASPDLLRALRGRPVFAVGEATAASALRVGFDDVEAADGDAGSLAALLATRLKPAATVAYLAGRLRNGGLEAALAETGFGCTTLETYDTRARTPGPGEIAIASQGGGVDAALLYSRNGARRLCEVAARPDVAALLAGARFLCLSGQVADGLEGVDSARVLIAARPDEQALFALLGQVSGTERG